MSTIRVLQVCDHLGWEGSRMHGVKRLFAWMSKSSESAMEFFKIPTNRVVELGSQLQI